MATDLALVPVSDTEARVFVLVDEFKSTWKRTLDQGVGLGQALIEHRDSLERGEWMRWLNERFELGKSMAYNLINLAENFQFVGSLPAGTGITEATKALARSRRTPRPLPDQVTDTDEETSTPLLLRYCLPGMTTAAIVNGIMRVCFGDARTCLDVTYGNGGFWKEGTPLKLVAHDLDEGQALDGAMDFTALRYDDAVFDVVVFDPPHLADGGESVMTGRFGTVATQAALEELITAGAREAWRVCSKGVVVKITDHVHARVFNDMSMLVCDAIATWPYDKVHQVRDHAFIDPSWGEQLSAYSNGSTYLIFRKDSQLHVPRRRSQG